MTDRPEGLSAEEEAHLRRFRPLDLVRCHAAIDRLLATLDAARDSRPVTADHPFHDEWAFQRSMSRGNEMAGKPIAADQPCFDCDVPFAEHGRDSRPVGEGLRYAPRPWVKNDDDPLDWLREAAHGFYDAKFGPAERSWIDDRITRLTDQPASTEVGEDG